MMARVKFKLKVLTPLFMGGADPHGEPELRAASIRGAIRFWFHAIAGAVTSDPGEVYKLESEVFGNTEKKSKVVVRVIKQPKSDSSRCLPAKAKYIGFGLWDIKTQAVRPCFHPTRTGQDEGEIEIIFSENIHPWAIYYPLWFIQNIGGLGARARKGFGSVIFSTTRCDGRFILKQPIKDVLSKPRKLLNHIRTMLKQNTYNFVTHTNFPSLSPASYQYAIIPTPYKNPFELLEKVNEAYNRLRTQKILNEGLKSDFLGFSKKGERRSSPLFIRPFRNRDNEPFSIILFIFVSKFYPNCSEPNFDKLFKVAERTFEEVFKNKKQRRSN